jgi:hypothetical protein
MSHAKTAFNSFEENLRNYGDANSHPEEYNLYNGLAHMAKAIEELQTELRRIKTEVEYLKVNHRR